MADFANLTEYTQRKSGDEIAVARGTGTGRLDLNIATKQTRVASEDLPTPSAALVDEIHNHNGKWFRCIVHPGTPPTVTFGTTYGDGDDVSTLWGEADGTYNFRGRSWTSSVSSPTSGDIVILPDGVFRRYTGSAWVSISTPNHWIGIFTTEFIAKAAAIALDEVASFNNLLAVVTAYAAPVSPEYVWEPQTVTNIVVYSKSRPQAAVENLHTLALSAITREMDLCINEPERSTEATGTWGDIDADAIVETQTIEDVTTYVEDDYYYDIFRDEFFFGTNVGGGTIRPLQDVADDALANSLNNTSNRVVWLHQHDSDEEALQQIPTIETGHEYFYWNRRNRTIRHLTNSTFVAAGSIVAHYKWAPVSGGLQIVDVTGSGGPSVNANNYRSLFVDFISGHVWIGLVRHISGEDPVGTYTDFVHTDFLGVYRDDGAAPDPSETKYFYASGQHGWRVRFYLSAPFTTAYWVWQHINFSQVGLFSSSDVWLGEAADDDALLHRMPDGADSSDTRRFVGYNRATGKIRLLTNSTYTEAVERHNEYTVVAY